MFVCPSIYEPQGIVNLEAMACEAAVVATDTGGIPEVVEDGVTGLLVPFATRDDGSGDPLDPQGFVARHRRAGERAAGRPGPRGEMGLAGRARAIEQFAWPAIAEQTAALYRRIGARS